VAEYAVEELGAALGVPYRSALTLVADALQLWHRLPRLWGLVQEGRLQAWKARQVAQPTLGRLRALVHEALRQHDPDTAAAREQTALTKQGGCGSTAATPPPPRR
jgi:hypothetical protein